MSVATSLARVCFSVAAFSSKAFASGPFGIWVISRTTASTTSRNAGRQWTRRKQGPPEVTLLTGPCRSAYCPKAAVRHSGPIVRTVKSVSETQFRTDFIHRVRALFPPITPAAVNGFIVRRVVPN